MPVSIEVTCPHHDQEPSDLPNNPNPKSYLPLGSVLRPINGETGEPIMRELVLVNGALALADT